MSGNKGNYVSHPIDLKYTTWKKKLKFPMTSCPYCVHKYYLVRRRVLNSAFELSTLTWIMWPHSTKPPTISGCVSMFVFFNRCWFRQLWFWPLLVTEDITLCETITKKCLPKGNCITMKVKNKRCTLVKHVSDVRMNENTSCFCFVCFFSLIEEENSTNEHWDSKVRGLWAYRYPMTDTITVTL